MRCISVSTQRQGKSREIFQSFVCRLEIRLPLKSLRKSYHQGRRSVLSDSSFFARKPVLAYFQDLTTLTFMTQKLISL